MRFAGLCTYPHGGLAGAGIFFSSLAALIATCYGCANCRFVLLTFDSDSGNFENFFLTNGISSGEQQLLRYRVGVGLFQWLRAVNDQDWSVGSCLGYQETMRALISDQIFETARGFAVVGVLLAFVVTLWGFLMACLSFHRLQVYLLRFLCLGGAIACGMSFLFLKSSLCTSQFEARRCEVDQGGLIMVAAVILWVASLLISIIFVRPETFSEEVAEKQQIKEQRDRADLVGQIAARRAAAKKKRQAEREAKERAKRHAEHDRNVQQLNLKASHSTESMDSFNQRHRRTAVKDRNDELEVYVSKRLDNIDRIMGEV